MEEVEALNLDDNERQVLQQIFNNRYISRVQISKNLEINKATISNLLNRLKHKKLVTEVGQGDSTKSGGRKPILLEVNKDFGYTISIDIAYYSLEILYSYFDGETMKHQSIPLKSNKMSDILEMIKQYVDTEDYYKTEFGLLGVAISVHGIVNEQQEIIDLPFHDLEDISIIEAIKQVTNVPVILENEANLSAIYERDYQGNLEINNLISLSIHKGIGAGLIIDKKLYRGNAGQAGEIGKTLITNFSTDEPTYLKIEDLCSQEAIIQYLTKQLNITMTVDKVKKHYVEGDYIVTQSLELFCKRIAVLVHNLNSQMNTEMIYINCPLINEIPELLEKIKRVSCKFNPNNNNIAITSNVKYATLMGASIAITQQILDIQDIKLNFK
ncbi:ROK family transcriptional regulator [Staphylococcus sp. ACRSN]|uniref:ROK family transcriptional regulator n=1 Tax=Staphylococcus sp. ACRSN TaxID=2918214 RepID=UPI001EF1D132|nr:ROK family transcriptional regulator [Staphylococcus sp. ACRSN]MCG7339157.1 ROK family transcriptional regulator [Staphylococcus sp. ACRSN]